MPKKFKGENSKAVEAKERRSAVEQDRVTRKKQAEEDAHWADDDKHGQRKQTRKDDKEKKRLDQLQRKQEAEALLQAEAAAIPAAKAKPAPKVTRVEIAATEARRAREEAQEREGGPEGDEAPLEENVNRLVTEGVEARSVEDAVAALSVKDTSVDMHPEKRMKAAYTSFEETRLPQLKAESPGLRLSQLKQLLRKEWMKHPDNPLIASMRQQQR